MNRKIVWLFSAFFLISGLFISSLLTAQEGLHPQLRAVATAIILSSDSEESAADLKRIAFESMVFVFVRKNQLNVVRTLVKQNENLHFRDADGNTLLHAAAAEGHTEVVKELANVEVLVDELNQANRSALFLAANGNHAETVKALLECGANVDGNSNVNSPLNTAAWYGNVEIVQQLISRGASVHAEDLDGNTPLHKAVRNGQFECVELLLKSGANKNQENSAGETPLEINARLVKLETPKKLIKRPWGTEQVLGKPDAGDAYSELEWCAKTVGKKEWLDLKFAKAEYASGIQVFAKPSPKCVEKVSVFDKEGVEHVVWTGELKDDSVAGKPAHVAEIRFKKTEFKTNRVKVYMDGARVGNWIYCDAVGLIDSQRFRLSRTGRIQYAAQAKSSSCYAPGKQPMQRHASVAELLSEN